MTDPYYPPLPGETVCLECGWKNGAHHDHCDMPHMPPLTDDARAGIRDAALEEAAAEADRCAGEWAPTNKRDALCARHVALAIRALKGRKEGAP